MSINMIFDGHVARIKRQRKTDDSGIHYPIKWLTVAIKDMPVHTIIRVYVHNSLASRIKGKVKKGSHIMFQGHVEYETCEIKGFQLAILTIKDVSNFVIMSK